MAKRKATQKDIAVACEVSQTLVSLVMSGGNVEVAEATRERILKTAKEMGYVPKKTPGLAKRSRVLAYIRPYVDRGHHGEHWIYDSYEEYYNRIQNRLVEEAYEAGYSLIVRPYVEAKELTHWLSEWGVDGVFWQSSDAALAQWIAKRYPMVQLHRLTVVNAPAVVTNPEEMILMAMDHLRANGHSRIVYLPLQPANEYLRKKRAQAYLDYTDEHGLPSFQEHMSFRTGVSLEKVDDLLFGMMEMPEGKRPTAAIMGDHSALLFMRKAQEKGYRIPEDLSLVGIDNTTASAFVQPSLTSMDTRMPEVARLATELMIKRIREPQEEVQKVFITPKLIARDSVRNIQVEKPKGTARHA